MQPQLRLQDLQGREVRQLLTPTARLPACTLPFYATHLRRPLSFVASVLHREPPEMRF